MAIRKRASISQTGLIASIEIAYFRSFYKLTVSDVGPLNIFFGENDTGKSNVMRALNLFFNDTVGDDYDFDFDTDFSSRRRVEAKKGTDLRKFVYIKIGFRTPPSHRQALGSEFFVKKTWSQLTGDGYRQEFSSHINTSGKQQSLTKFLNKIVFTYIPAVKARSVYEDLLRESYNAISQSEQFSEALNTFTARIREQTGGLAERLNASLGMSSSLSPPTDLAELFASLDFETLVGGGQPMSLLRQRGDGVQARHIPEILSFISDKDKTRLYIWGIEEPENSLSMASSTMLAKRLKHISGDGNVQTFLTTHSPAFYSTTGHNIKKFFLKSGLNDVEILDGSSASTPELMAFMGDDFFIPVIADSLRRAAEEREVVEQEVSALKEKVENSSRPLLFVEGETEEKIFSHILNSINPDWARRLEIVSLGGTTHAERLGALTEGILTKLLQGREGFVLLDSDKAGQSALPKTVESTRACNGWVASSNRIWWRTLKPTEEADEAFTLAGIPTGAIRGVCLEDCFPAAVRAKAMEAGAYGLGDPREFVHKADMFVVSSALNDETAQFYLRRPDDALKMTFVKWLIEQGNVQCDLLSGMASELLSRTASQ